MKYVIVVVAVLLITVYGFKIHLPTATGTLVIDSGFVSGSERQ